MIYSVWDYGGGFETDPDELGTVYTWVSKVDSVGRLSYRYTLSIL